MKTPLLALTMGDPAGVGPEVIVGAWSNARVHEGSRPFVVGHPEILHRAAKVWSKDGKRELQVREIASPEEAEPSPQVIPCLRSGSDDVLAVPPCSVDPRAGQAAYDALVMAAQLALAGRVDAITTAPLHKAALWQAGH